MESEKQKLAEKPGIGMNEHRNTEYSLLKCDEKEKNLK